MTLGEYHYKLSGKVIIPPKARKFFTRVKFFLIQGGCIGGIPSADGNLADKRGRVTVPSELRMEAHFKDEVIVLGGSDDYLEVWSKDSWDLEVAEAQSEAARIGSEFS